MQNNHLNYVEFKSNNLEQTKEFYQKAFAWKFKDYGPSYTSFKESGIFGGFELTDQKISNGALLVIYHADLESIKAKVEHLGAKITKEIFSFPGGRRFHFTDHSGNELAIWSDK